MYNLLGDRRNNQNPHLAALITIALRDHNRIATELAQINPHWKDEKIIQVTRMIEIGKWQHVFLNEIFKIYVGKSFLEHIKDFMFNYGEKEYLYNSSSNPAALTEFSIGAWRNGHSMVAGHLE